MARKKNRYFLLTPEQNTEKTSIPVEWDKLPDEVVEKCRSEVIHDVRVYSKKKQFTTTSVIFFDEITQEDFENIGTEVETVEDTKNKIMYIL